jgi:hypothetical protein
MQALSDFRGMVLVDKNDDDEDDDANVIEWIYLVVLL